MAKRGQRGERAQVDLVIRCIDRAESVPDVMAEKDISEVLTRTRRIKTT